MNKIIASGIYNDEDATIIIDNYGIISLETQTSAFCIDADEVEFWTNIIKEKGEDNATII